MDAYPPKYSRSIPPKSVDLIVTDLPYGVTGHDWDKVLPLPRRGVVQSRLCPVHTPNQMWAEFLSGSVTVVHIDAAHRVRYPVQGVSWSDCADRSNTV